MDNKYIKKRIYHKDCLIIAKEQNNLYNNYEKVFYKISKYIDDFIMSYNNSSLDIFGFSADEVSKAFGNNGLKRKNTFNKRGVIIENIRDIYVSFLSTYFPESKAKYNDYYNFFYQNKDTDFIGLKNNLKSFELGEFAETKVKQTLDIYNYSFRPENCLYNVVLQSYIGDKNITRETDAILVTKVGVYVLEIKYNQKATEKGEEQMRLNTENIKRILSDNGIEPRVYPKTIAGQDADFSKALNNLIDEYNEREALVDNRLYSDDVLKNIVNIIKQNELQPIEPIEYYYNEKNEEYDIKGYSKYPSFSYLLCNEAYIETELDRLSSDFVNINNDTRLLNEIQKYINEEIDKYKTSLLLNEQSRLEAEKRVREEENEEKRKLEQAEKHRKQNEILWLIAIPTLIIGLFVAFIVWLAVEGTPVLLIIIIVAIIIVMIIRIIIKWFWG